jgi:hypothetical protein
VPVETDERFEVRGGIETGGKDAVARRGFEPDVVLLDDLDPMLLQ